MNTTEQARLARNILAAGLALGLLAGCGGADEEENPVSSAAYLETLAYCGSTEPAGALAAQGGWEMTSPTRTNPRYEINALVSPRGAEIGFAPPLQIGIQDYRGVSGPFVPSGVAAPEAKMGMILQGSVPANTAACVQGLAKLTPPAPAFDIPGLSLLQPATGTTLAWRSKWDVAVPIDRVPGMVIDGFEFVSSVTPARADAFFTLAKSRFAAPASLSVCYLAPGAAGWQCTAPNVADSGRNWVLSRPAGGAGVYVVAAPAP